jgi:ribulose 1,5-bisphosphate synthetase/thiazole synthase
MANSHERFDVVVIGAGHNGLVAAGYLARAGKKVMVVEQRDRVCWPLILNLTIYGQLLQDKV